jgi:Fe-S-cluster containining protein
MLDALRLRTGMEALRAAEPSTATAIEERARAWLTEFGPDFPGDPATGILGTTNEEQARFEDFANDAPCPALNPATGLCDVYEWRPMTCRVFGPPIRMNRGDALGCCELCFVGASEAEIASCEMPVPHELEASLVAEVSEPEGHEEGNNTAEARETLVAFALLR